MADVELLPLPDWMECLGEISASDIRDYARANVEHHTAPLQAENERLRAEVERLNAELSRLDVIAGYGGVSSDAPERLILASEVYDGVQSCDKWCDVRRVVDDGQPMPESATAYVRADRAERLAEALRNARARTADLAAWLRSGNDVPADLPFVFRERWQKIAADIQALEAAIAQEDRND